MNKLQEPLAIIFLLIMMLLFANMAGVALDKEEKARHDMIENREPQRLSIPKPNQIQRLLRSSHEPIPHHIQNWQPCVDLPHHHPKH